MIRLFLAILAGLALNIVFVSAIDHVMHLSGIYPPYGEPMLDHGLLLLAFIYRAVFMMLSGYCTAILAKEKSRQAVLVLGVLGSLLWLAGAITMWDYAYPWYNVTGVVLGLPVTLMGWLIHENQKEKTV